MPAEQSARSVCEEILERSGAALISGDWEAFRHCFVLPLTFETFSGMRTIEDDATFKALFDQYQRYLCDNGITDLNRHCAAAEYRDIDTIVATHITRMVSGTVLVFGPFPVLALLRRTEEGWKVAQNQFALPADTPEAFQKVVGPLLPVNDPA